MMATVSGSIQLPIGWLRGASFDRFFIIGLASVAIASGLVVVVEPVLFVPILALDLWLLGYHHVVSTFTRLCFDAESLREYRFLIFGLPLIVVATVAGLSFGVGLWTITTIYLYWQWFHYARQSWGISQAYRRKAERPVPEGRVMSNVIFYLVPVWGILYRSHQAPASFLGVELRVIPVPGLLVDIVGIAALASVAWWAATRFTAWRRGELAVAHTLYQLSHFAVFTVAYVLIADVDAGWLVVNVWHNAQYIAYVWHYNNSRFRKGVDPEARFLSTISQDRNVWAYLGVCLAISTTSYFLVGSLAAAVVTPMIVFQSANFHHYIVDGLIWKRRRQPVQQPVRVAA